MLYTINGKFLSEQLTGMQRYAYEILNEIDKICLPNELEILVPKYVEDIPQYKNIKVIRYGNKKGILWEQIDLPKYLRKNKRKCFNLLSIAPILSLNGIIVAHGVNYKVNPQFFKTFRDKLSRLWHIFNFYFYFKYTKKIITVSNFSKSEIVKTYGVNPNRITIASNSWQHMNYIKEADDTFSRFKYLKPKDYYFSMSSVNDNKNFKWIAEVALKNPSDKFAIAGGRSLISYFERLGISKPDNLYFLGYVSDNDAKTLMKNCKAFLFPTLYEGFGIPPLEAMACGAKCIVSDTQTMHEVYENSVYYINPYNSNVNLDRLLNNKVNDNTCVLQKYSWEKSAKIIYYNVIKNM